MSNWAMGKLILPTLRLLAIERQRDKSEHTNSVCCYKMFTTSAWPQLKIRVIDFENQDFSNFGKRFNQAFA
jgi:hypothetical protein